MKPVRCPSCYHFVLRDPSVVDNSVTCPNSECEHEFCWICLKNLNGNADNNHFDNLNYMECMGK